MNQKAIVRAEKLATGQQDTGVILAKQTHYSLLHRCPQFQTVLQSHNQVHTSARNTAPPTLLIRGQQTFYKGPDRETFWLCEPYRLSCNQSSHHYSLEAAIHDMSWAWLCYNKALFAKTGGALHLARELYSLSAPSFDGTENNIWGENIDSDVSKSKSDMKIKP